MSYEKDGRWVIELKHFVLNRTYEHLPVSKATQNSEKSNGTAQALLTAICLQNSRTN